MTIITAPVGYQVGFIPVGGTGLRGVNPYKDSVFIDPRTGQLTTWQPGLKPEQEEQPKKKSGAKKGIIALGLAALTAFLFRGKIKNSKIWKNTIAPALTSAKNWATKTYNTVKTKATPYIKKGVEYAKNVANKVVNWFKKLTTKPSALPPGAIA